MSDPNGAPLKRTSLYDLHVRSEGKMVPFAGYEMPVQFPAGVLKEHLHTRAAAGLFDVSHMGQLYLHGDGAAAALETLVPGDIQALAPGCTRYTQFTTEAGGILDDLMVTQAGDRLYLVVNAACKEADIALLRDGLPKDIAIELLDDRALIALQGPMAAAVLARLAPQVAEMPFMSSASVMILGTSCTVGRGGYTGEDGFEISVPASAAEDLAAALLNEAEVVPIGLGARDSLRLESGLCLYGHDIDTTTTPIEAGLLWSISKRRRAEGGFPGDAVIQRQIKDGVARKRVGLRPEGRAPAREGTRVTDEAGAEIGTVTSGGFGPSVGGPVSMAYVSSDFASIGTSVLLEVRNKAMAASVVAMPFVPQRYYRG
ncbi:MAG: glycine cleavage system aminomethyltransferase GcvT [Alphaproteobacteria bacterium]|nr:glycine cleavage system aminomethyltransferase GcvT [Alphaproteobacteria bacterium]